MDGVTLDKLLSLILQFFSSAKWFPSTFTSYFMGLLKEEMKCEQEEIQGWQQQLYVCLAQGSPQMLVSFGGD